MWILGPSKRYTKLNPSVFVPSVQTRNVRLSFIGAQKEILSIPARGECLGKRE
jgi:hypothetical protein